MTLSVAEREAVLKKALELKKAELPILNSSRQLKAMIENTWSCHDDILINVTTFILRYRPLKILFRLRSINLLLSS